MYSYYIPFVNSNLNAMNQAKQEFYDPYKGLMKGNLFPNEYLPYRNYANYPIKPSNEREQLLSEVQAYGFALKDLNLYLDLHKDDQQALSLYRKYLSDYKNATTAYENKFGPLTLKSNVLGNYPWSWVEGPWPWERG